MSAPTGDGGAAAVLCSEEFVRKHHLEVRVLKIVGLINEPEVIVVGPCVCVCILSLLTWMP